MRQPEVARRLVLLVVAVIVCTPAVAAVWSAVVAAAFLTEFLTSGSYRPLSTLTAEPVVASSATPGRAVYRPAAALRQRPLVLVHGYAPAGHDEPRLVAAARLLARAGFEVVVPTIPGLTQGRLRPEDATPIVAALAETPAPALVVGVSIGAGPAVLAAADPMARGRVRAVLLLGGYGSARELLRFWLTGEYEFGRERGRAAHEPSLVAAFVEANTELVDAELRRTLVTGDPQRVDAALASLAPGTKRLLEQLSPERVVPSLTVPIVLVHGRDDPAIPYTESLRLAAARPLGTQVVLLGLIHHVDATRRGIGPATLRDAGQLWSVVYALRQIG